jgi:ribonuclease R
MSAAAAPARRPGPLVGILQRRGRFFVVERFFERGPRVAVDKPRRDVREGDLVLVRPGGKGGRRAVVERSIGRPDVARDVLEGLMLDRGLSRRFDPAVERAAREAAPEPGVREDLRSLPTFTIDPASARDFDDAISASVLGPDLWRVWVHIADVSAHVPAGGLVDREAWRRGTSVYVPGAVEPMLPSSLSSDACSLVPGEDRLAVTVELELAGAVVRRARFHRSLIRSDARLTYEQVDRIFAGSEAPSEPWAEPLAAARAAAAALAAARASRGALVVESAEPDFSFDEAGHVVAVEHDEQTESHRVIEHLMIAANEAVAGRLDQGGVPALYRVHERPEAAAVERLVEQLASLDVPTPPVPENMSPSQAADLVGQISVLVDQEVRRRGHGRQAFTSLVLRALKQARYDPVNLGHAGLQSVRYCHFTSPIRRYPDLVCHRALLSTLDGSSPAPDRTRLGETATWASAREREAMSIERAADDVARCFLLERELFEGGWEQDWAGEVVGLVGAGAFVAFGDGYDGFLGVRRLRGEWWELNEQGTVLVGTRSGRALRLGDPVRVEVDRVEPARGRVDLLPVEV